ncbi:MAG: carbohydrate ABC transporter permease, partial [Firmicutes bacterium]|nr:carbohydrate ABC transporter permease [Bacillota bacterium]
NTILIVAFTLFGVLGSSSLSAYGFARLRFPGRDAIFMILLSTMMLPGVVLMIPQFVMFRNLGWIDTFKPLIIPHYFGGGAFNVFLLRQFFRSLPEELSDAARIDGCGEFKIYYRIILPLAKPALATIGIFTFMGTWNDFMGPLIYLNSPEKRTLALGLASFRSLYATHWNLLMAASTVMVIPIIVLFFGAQRHFVQGIVLTGLKG